MAENNEGNLSGPIIRQILIATQNKGKLAEYQQLFAPLKVGIVSLNAFPYVASPDETESTFAANAALKARVYARQTGEWAVADDSGLEVSALGGAPGVLSARFGGEGLSDSERTMALLAAIEASKNPDRSARFVCAIALADPAGNIALTAEGVCKGKIAAAPRGGGGFGYDPIFIPQGESRTFAEMTRSEKESVSHRGQAFRDFIRKFRIFTGI